MSSKKQTKINRLRFKIMGQLHRVGKRCSLSMDSSLKDHSLLDMEIGNEMGNVLIFEGALWSKLTENKHNLALNYWLYFIILYFLFLSPRRSLPMKNSLADELSSILTSLRRQNKDISNTLCYLKKTKSMDNIRKKITTEATNPETKESSKHNIKVIET